MKKKLTTLFYVFIATALVTIAPFLITFEKGQDIERGLFEFGVLAILLFYVALKEHFLFLKKKMLVIATYVMLVAVSWVDLLTILAEKKWSVGLYGLIPFTSCLMALFLLKDVKGMSLRQVNIVLFVSFFAHFGAMGVYPEQPLLQFSVPLYLAQRQHQVNRNHLSVDFRTRYNVTDSVSVTKYHVDTTRSNMVVLVESWGIPMDSVKFNEELAVFDGLLKEQGVHLRWYSRTRVAERTDLLDSVVLDSIGLRDSLFMPNRFVELGYKTTFLFGGDSTIQRRHKYICNIGFLKAIWTDSATDDSVMAAKIDSLLSQPDSIKHFVAWTTRDTRFPISEDSVETEKIYYERLFGTLKMVADLAKKHPEVRFVVQGDHEPILSSLEFQAKFYRRWVPYVVLN